MYSQDRERDEFIAEQRRKTATGDGAFLELSNFKHCPICCVPIEKMQGCLQMTCMCKTSFCWKCLAVNGASGCSKLGCNGVERTNGQTDRFAETLDLPVNAVDVAALVAGLKFVEDSDGLGDLLSGEDYKKCPHCSLPQAKVLSDNVIAPRTTSHPNAGSDVLVRQVWLLPQTVVLPV